MSTFFTFENIITGLLGGAVLYIVVRVLFYAIFTSWWDAKRQAKGGNHE